MVVAGRECGAKGDIRAALGGLTPPPDRTLGPNRFFRVSGCVPKTARFWRAAVHITGPENGGLMQDAGAVTKVISELHWEAPGNSEISLEAFMWRMASGRLAAGACTADFRTC